MGHKLNDLSFRGAKATRNLQSVVADHELQIPRCARDDNAIGVFNESLGAARR